MIIGELLLTTCYFYFQINMPYRTCSVYDCEDKLSSRHSFPNPDKYPEVFHKWLRACGNKELLRLSSQAIYKSRKVCHIHFNRGDIKSNMFLKEGACPTLFLSSTSVIESMNIFNMLQLTSSQF